MFIFPVYFLSVLKD